MAIATSTRFFTRAFQAAMCTALLAGCATNSDDLAVTVTGSPTPDPAIARDAAVATIYAAAKRRDSASLLALGTTTDPAVALGLYSIDRDRYRTMFVADYPHTTDGVNNDYGLRLERSGLFTRADYPVRALGDLAIAGVTDARKSLLTALPYATAGNATVYGRESARMLAAVSPEAALVALAQLPPDIRLAATSEITWCSPHPDRILAFTAQPLPTPTPLPTPVPTPRPSDSVSAVAASPLPTMSALSATISTTGAPGSSPSPSPTPLEEALVQAQIRQTLGTCDVLVMRKSTTSKHRSHPPHVAKLPT